MQLSILIPCHNYDCRSLVRSLCQQVDHLDTDCEIIVADDGSDNAQTLQLCREIAQMPHCRFIERPVNVGRSAIRNFLADEAQGEWLLFMDQDGEVVWLHFLRNYLEAAHGCDVVCGGLVHTRHRPSSLYSLRYDYEQRCASRFTAEQRRKDPILPFRTFCFMIRKEAFQRVRFDESFTGYGYEDVLFGRQLREAGLRIHHINNPLKNTDIEPNPLFVEKTEEALRTLHQHESVFADDVLLVRTVRRLEALHLLPLAKTLSSWFCPRLRNNLCSNRPITRLFNVYKLAYFVGLK